MALDQKRRRRLLGTVVLLAAVLMLVAGETVLKGRLSAGGFLIFWLIGIAFTLTAILIALRDVRALREETTHEQKELLKNTIEEIQSDAKHKRGEDEASPE